MNKVDWLLERINWHKNYVKGFSNDLKPLLSFKNKYLLPPIYHEFYEKIGVGEIGSDSIKGQGYCVVNLFEPDFINSDHPSWDDIFDNHLSSEWFNGKETSKCKDILLLGHDVDRNWFGFDIVKKTLVNQREEKYLDTKDIVDYVKSIMLSVEEYQSIFYPN
jgi:hypothetical protein